MVDGGSNRGGNAGQANLADTASAKLIYLFVWIVEEGHVDRGASAFTVTV